MKYALKVFSIVPIRDNYLLNVTCHYSTLPHTYKNIFPNNLKLVIVLFMGTMRKPQHPLLNQKASKTDTVHCSESKLRARRDVR